MMMAKHHLLLIPLFISLSACYRVGVFKERETKVFENIFKYCFNDFNCVSILGDADEDLIKAIFRAKVPVILQGFQKYCHGYLVLAKDLDKLKGIVRELKNFYDDRIFVYLLQNHENLTDFLKDNYKMFGEAEVLLASYDNKQTVYKYNRTTQIFGEPFQLKKFELWRNNGPVLNFHGRKFVVSTFNCPMFVDFGTLDENGRPRWIKGLDFVVFDLLAQKMNITYSIINPPENFLSWGVRQLNGSWKGGILELLDNGKADISFASVFITVDKYLNFYMPHMPISCKSRFLVRRPHLLPTNWSSMFRSFPLSVWLILLMAVFINSWATMGITGLMNVINNTSYHREYSTFGKSLFLSIGVLLGGGIPSSSQDQGPLRHSLTSWIITCFLMATCFGSSLVSYLTTPDMEHRAQTIKEFVNEGYFWAKYYKPPNGTIFDHENPWQRTFAERLVLVADNDEYAKLIDNDKLTIWGKYLEGLGYILNEIFTDKKLKEWEVSSEDVQNYLLCLVIKHGSSLIVPIEKYMSWMVQGGIMNKIVQDEFVFNGRPYMREVLIKTKSSPGASVLKLSNFQGLFYIFAGGLALALITFTAECYLVSRKRVTITYMNQNKKKVHRVFKKY